MSALDNLTVSITNFHRAVHLERAIKSVRAAGVRNLVIVSAEPDADVMAVVARHAHGWRSFIHRTVATDCGCNALWLLVALHSTTDQLLLLHDDDLLAPEFGKAYESIIAPELAVPGTMASWRADLYFEDGRSKSTEYWHGPTRVMASSELAKVFSPRGRLSLSPIVSIMHRATVINAAKESEQTLLHNDCLYRQGMLLGTEVIAYSRMVRAFPRWLYVDQILSRYGSHDGSGTIAAEKNNGIGWLTKGYDIARAQCVKPQPPLKPKIIFVYYNNDTGDIDEIARNAAARESWDFHFSQGDMIEFPVSRADLKRSSADIGDSRDVPYVKDLFEAGLRAAMPEDIVVYCNRDIILSSTAVERIIAGVARGRGVTCCQRRRITPAPGRFYKDFANCKTDGGFDVFAVTPAWWRKHAEKMPDMFVGREAWDSCFRCIAEETADQRGRLPSLTGTPEQWAKSNAYTDHVAGHKNHESNWIVERMTSKGNIHNRKLAREFFAARGNQTLVALLQEG